jgi:two-component system chemotaxis sensor kinase CheA
MSDVSDVHRQAFKEEAYELLGELESSLLELEERPDDTDLIGRVFRAMHTIKGSGSMFGFDDIARFTHEVETVFDLVRNGKLAVTRTLVNLTLAARDQIKSMLDASEEGEVDPGQTSQIITGLRALLPQDGEQPAQAPAAKQEAPPEQEAVTYRIRFTPAREIFSCGANPLNLRLVSRICG